MKELKDHLRPEFINRLDNIIVFKPLTHASIKEIVRINILDLEKRIQDKNLN